MSICTLGNAQSVSPTLAVDAGLNGVAVGLQPLGDFLAVAFRQLLDLLTELQLGLTLAQAEEVDAGSHERHGRLLNNRGHMSPSLRGMRILVHT